MSALDPTADDAVPAAAIHRAVPARTYVTWTAIRTYCPDKVPTLQQFLAQHVDTVVRA
jgi:hypothetical protein